ncbi:MAG TPA: hypothetical protein VLX92_22795 [Kofleriaceae bacterium]|nr:hypothetical protein [Kofleriaceae bacterium]
MRMLALVALAGCTHTAVSAQPTALAAHAAELEALDRARVEVVQGGQFDVDGERVVSVTFPGNQRSHFWGLYKTGTPDRSETITIHNLVASCARDGTGKDCALARLHDPISVGTRRSLDGRKLAMGLFGAVATAIGGVCLATCQNHSGWAAVGTSIGAATLLYPLSTVF